MKKASSESRIDSIAAVEISIKFQAPSVGSSPEPVISTNLALLNTQKSAYGEIKVNMARETLTKPWPSAVRKLALELQSAIEDHLLEIYFTNEGGKQQDGKREHLFDIETTGLGGSGLGSPEDEPEPI